MLKLPATTSLHDFIALRGGLDLLTPTLSLKPGVCREAQNFEAATTGGYTRIHGYERFDGRFSPSEASYLTITLNVTGAIAAGAVIEGATSGAVGTVIYVNAGLFAYTKASGTFQVGEDIEVAAVVQATVIDLTGAEDALDFDVRMRYLAAEVYRADIAAVPGSGPIRGGVQLSGMNYAFRDNVGATALAVYKQSGSGWTLVPMLNTVSFTLGTSEYVDGETLVQGGASAPIVRVVLQSGTWASGDAAGRLIIGTVTGGPFAAGAALGGGAATLSGANAAITLLPGGSLEFDIGAVGSVQRAYAADGVNKGFEFDGVAVVPIVTGNTVDVPERVMVHAGHLWFSFDNSVQLSGLGTPYNWTALAGAAELLADGRVTVMKRLQGGQSSSSAAICHEQGMHILYGTTTDDFNLVTFEDSTGAKARTAQLLGQLFVLDDRGVMGASTSQNYGNFSGSSLTMPIRPFIQTRRNTATGSLVNREKNQYRLFFGDGAGLYITMSGGKLLGSMPVQFPDVVRCCWTGESPDGTEVAYFGSDDGFVYKLDAGTSFDGEEINAYFGLNFANQGNSRQVKRYRKVTAELSIDAYVSFDVSAEVAYGSTEREQWASPIPTEAPLAPAYWDALTWDTFTWDGRNLNPVNAGIDSSGENIALRVASASAMYDAFTINSLIVTYSPRRGLR